MRSAGLFDLQVNGFAGVDFNSDGIGAQRLDHALEAMLATGVTSCLPTLITAPADRLAARFAALDRAVAASKLGLELQSCTRVLPAIWSRGSRTSASLEPVRS